MVITLSSVLHSVSSDNVDSKFPYFWKGLSLARWQMIGLDPFSDGNHPHLRKDSTVLQLAGKVFTSHWLYHR